MDADPVRHDGSGPFPPVFHVGVLAPRQPVAGLPAVPRAQVDACLDGLAAALAAARQQAGEIYAPGPTRVRLFHVADASADDPFVSLVAASARARGIACHPIGIARTVESAADIAPENGEDDDPDAEAVRQVLARSDLVLTFGADPRHTAAAGALGVPVLQIPASPDGAIRLMVVSGIAGSPATAGPDWQTALAQSVTQAMVPGPDPVARAAADRYLHESRASLRWLARLHVPLERLLLIGSPAWRRPSGNDPEIPPTPLDAAMDRADLLAIHYAGLVRSTVVLRYLLILPTILGATLGFYGPTFLSWAGLRPLGFGLQGLSLAAILLLARLAQRHDWLTRFADYRLLTEALRHQRTMGPLGLAPPHLEGPVHRPAASGGWVAWAVRATVRAEIPPDAEGRADALDRIRRGILADVTSQLAYHRATARRCGILARRLNSLGMHLFSIGLAAVVVRAAFLLAVDLGWIGAVSPKTVTLFNAAALIIPALAPVFLGLRAQAEFGRLEQQSTAMVVELEQLRLAFTQTVSGRAHLVRLAETARRVMMLESADWRLVVKARPVSAS